MLDHGAIAERGTHDELLEAGGLYAQLVAGFDAAPPPLDPEFAS